MKPRDGEASLTAFVRPEHGSFELTIRDALDVLE